MIPNQNNSVSVEENDKTKFKPESYLIDPKDYTEQKM